MKPDRGQKILASRPLRFMGKISYTFYLYQLAVLDKLGQYVHSHLEVVILGFLITGVFSTASWYLVESKILKLRLESPIPALEAKTV